MEKLTADDPPRIGPYRLIARLGAGGMGRVYLARSEGGRTVAVKVVQSEFAQHSEFRSRFAREVAAARRVGGAWTAAVLDADTDARTPWVATQYVPGPDLHAVVSGQYGPLPEESVRFLANRLAFALQAIHQTGLVHRDLKPSNVLVTVDGPRVIDFGIARALDSIGGDSLQTRTGMVIGSPGFMSPEQVRGRHVSSASDVFCLGSLLAYAATGRPPFGAAGHGVHAQLFRVAEEEPELDGVPAGLLALIRECLQKDAALRPTPGEVAARTTTESGREWLPGALLAQLGRHAAQLLDFDPLRPRTSLVPEPSVVAPVAAQADTADRTGRRPAVSSSAAFADALTVGGAQNEAAGSHGPPRTRAGRRRPALVAGAAAALALALGLFALRPWQDGKQQEIMESAPTALRGSWEAALDWKGSDGLPVGGLTARLVIGAGDTIEYSLLSRDRLCVWESSITASRTGSENGSEGDAIRLGTRRLKSTSPKSEAARCEDNTDDYGNVSPDGPGAFVITPGGRYEWAHDSSYFDYGNNGSTTYRTDEFRKATPAKGPLPSNYQGSWSGRGKDGTYRLEVTLGHGATKQDIRLVSISNAIGEKCAYKATVFSREAGLLRTTPAEPADSTQPSGCAKSAPSLTFQESEDKGQRRMSLEPIGGEHTPLFEAAHWVGQLHDSGN